MRPVVLLPLLSLALATFGVAPAAASATPDVVNAAAAPALSAASLETVRYTGSDRYDVAVAISREFEPGVPVVYIAKGTDYPDSLSAAPAAAAQGGPMLLVAPTAIPSSVVTELNRLQPQKIVVVGGEGSVSPEVFAQLASFVPGSSDIIRIGGADRYEASRNVNTYAFGASGVERVYLATGTNFPDALSASAVAGSHDGAVLLVYGPAGGLDEATRDQIALLNPNNIVIAGGPGSVSNGIQSAVSALGLPGGSQRLSGIDRFEASQAINHETYTSADTVYVATGFNFPDALAGAALAGRDAGPLYVVRTDCIPQSILADIMSFGSPRIVLFGGPASLTGAVANLQGCAMTPPTGSISFTCSPSPTLTATITNPNALDIDVVIQLGVGPSVTVTVPAGTTGTFSGPTPNEDTTVYGYLRYNGAYVYTTTVHRDCSAPSNPGDTVNCPDFATQAAAQAWFLFYYPHYGDIAKLDQDNDMVACESLP